MSEAGSMKDQQIMSNHKLIESNQSKAKHLLVKEPQRYIKDTRRNNSLMSR